MTFEAKVSQEEFRRWVGTAKSGEQLVYGTGNYCAKANGVKYEPADAAWTAHKARQALLFQRRMGGGVYECLAIRAPMNFGQLDRKK